MADDLYYSQYNPQVGYGLQGAQFNLQQQQWNWQVQQYQQQQAQQQAAAQQSMAGLNSLINSYNTSFNAAQALNESQYQAEMAAAGTETGQKRADIISAFGAQGSQQMQQLAKLGMGNTTVGQSLGQGNMRQQQAALNTAADTSLQTKLGIMENRNIMYPTTDIISALTGLIGQQTGIYGTGGISTALGGMTLGAGTGAAGTTGTVGTSPSVGTSYPAVSAAQGVK
jgi:hypothetical protein